MIGSDCVEMVMEVRFASVREAGKRKFLEDAQLKKDCCYRNQGVFVEVLLWKVLRGSGRKMEEGFLLLEFESSMQEALQ